VIDAGFPQERVRKCLVWLAEEMEPNLIRMASAFHERSKQLVFLINNYDLILSVHMVRDYIVTAFRSELYHFLNAFVSLFRKKVRSRRIVIDLGLHYQKRLASTLKKYSLHISED